MANGKGRDPRREAYWRRTMRRQERSGLTIREFCHRQDLAETAFYYWRKELARRQVEPGRRRRHTHPSMATAGTAGPAAHPRGFVSVRLAASPAPTRAQGMSTAAIGRIVIEVSGGRRVHVVAPVDRQALADVLAVLAVASSEQRAGNGRDGASPEEGRPC
jgi:hypothetical protein